MKGLFLQRSASPKFPIIQWISLAKVRIPLGLRVQKQEAIRNVFNELFSCIVTLGCLIPTTDFILKILLLNYLCIWMGTFLLRGY